jgi:hypothetical protein
METPWSGIGSVTAALIGAGALICANVYAKRRETQQKAEQEIRVKKTEVYETLIELMFNQLMGSKQGKKQLTSDELLKALAKLMPRVVVWASPKVIAHWNYIKNTSSHSQSSLEIMKTWDTLLLLIREDLGHNDAALAKFELTRLFVNDLDEHLQTKK